MKKIITFFTILCIASSVFFSSCNKGAKTNENKNGIDTISVTFGLDTTFFLDQNIKDGYTLKLSIKGEFPQNKTLRELLIKECFDDSLSTATSDSPQEAIKKYRDISFEDFKTTFAQDSLVDDPDDPGCVDVFYQRQSRLDKNVYRVEMTDGIVSYCDETTGYSCGAAHGYHTLKYIAFDLNTNKRITEASTFVNGYQDKLNELLVKYMMEQYHANNFNDLLDKRLLLVDKKDILPNGNFYVTNYGIVYCFNEYEISAYAAGETTVTIPFFELAGLIKNSSPLYKYCPVEGECPID